MLDLVTTVLELAAVALLALGAALAVTAVVGGLLGAGAGFGAAAFVLAAADAILRMLQRPERERRAGGAG